MIPWLPDTLVLNNSSPYEIYSTLYEVFKHDFIEKELYFRGEKITFQTAIDPNIEGNYPHGFTHIVTRKNGNVRIIDDARAERLPWVRPIIEHPDDPNVTVINRTQSSEKYGIVDNTYLWLAEKNFIVVLRRIKKGIYKGQMLITAYSVTEPYEKKRLMQWKNEQN